LGETNDVYIMKITKHTPKKQNSPITYDITKGYISSIHNYCDRWCEKCAFTAYCRVFAMDAEYREKHPDRKDDMEGAMQQVGDMFAETMVMLHKMAAEKGIDLNELEEVEPWVHPQPNHPIILLTEEYGYEVHQWLKTNRQRFEEEATKWALISEEKARIFIEAWETLQWYSFFVSVKYKRALLHDDDDEFAQWDRLGSAKTAILATERSIAALAVLLAHLPDEEDVLLGFLTKLEKARKSSLVVFPDAMDFVRPGLDEY
jgi:hypothetical protein